MFTKLTESKMVTVWPDLVKFRQYGNKIDLGNSWKICLVFGEMFNYFSKFVMLLGKF